MKKVLAVTLFALSLSGAALLAGCSHPQPVVYGPPPPAVEIHQQGVHDGFEAAKHDVAEGRPPQFARHPRYRNPPVPGPAWGDYRNGFREGYAQFLHQEPPPPPPPPGV